MGNLFRPANVVLRALPARERLPHNHRLPPIYHPINEGPAEPPREGEFARSPRLALVEAALIAADEPLTARRLAQAAGLKDAAEARALVRQLQELYEREGSAVEVVGVAGGFQLLAVGGVDAVPGAASQGEQRTAAKPGGARNAGGHRLSSADHASRHRGHPRCAVRRRAAPADGEEPGPHRRPRRLSGSAGAVWDHEEVLAANGTAK